MPTPDDATQESFQKAKQGVAGVPDAGGGPPSNAIDSALSALNWVITRSARFVADPVPHPFDPEHVRSPRIAGSHIRIGIASVPIPLNQLVARKMSTKDAQYFQLYGLKPHFRKRLHAKLNHYVELACQHDCRFILLNEMAFPLEGTRSSTRARNRELLEFVQQAKSSLTRDDHPRYVVAGTFHDPASKYNLAPMVVRAAGTDPNVSHLHSKKTSATRLGEKVRLPPDRTLRLYRTAYGHMAVMICLDFYDASQVLSLVQYNHSKDLDPEPSSDRIELLSIVSFGMDRETLCAKAAEDVSRLLGAAVAFCHSRGDQSRQYFYVGGNPVDPVEVEPRSGPPELSVFELRADDLHSAWDESRTFRRPVHELLTKRSVPDISRIKIY